MRGLGGSIDYKELVERLEKMLPLKIPYGELVGAPWPYNGQGEMVYEDPESYFIEQAITAITDLLARIEAAEARVEKTERERNAAVKTIFKWTGCPECKHWDSKDEWCKKHDRYANSFGRCSTPEWCGLKEE